MGSIGNYIVMIFIILFSFSTITTGYYYGESSLKFLLKKTNKFILLLFKLLVIFILFLGCILSPTIIWNVADTLIVLLAIINTYALFVLRKEVINEYQCYKKKKYDIIKFR
jgi:AGCS family alanine or glycine:cation symporter